MFKELWLNGDFWKLLEVTWEDIRRGYVRQYAITPQPVNWPNNPPEETIMKQVLFIYDPIRKLFNLDNEPDVYFDRSISEDGLFLRKQDELQ